MQISRYALGVLAAPDGPAAIAAAGAAATICLTYVQFSNYLSALLPRILNIYA